MRFLKGALALALALSLAGVGTVLAQEGTFAAPEPLTVGTPVTATITGEADGAFSYYTVEHPGENALMALVFVLDEAGAAAQEGTVGVNIRGARAYLMGDATPDDDTDMTLLHILAGDAEPATWPIQVYSFAEEEVGYTLVVYTLTVDALMDLIGAGVPLPIGTPTVPAEPTAAATPTAAASPTTAATPTTATTPTTAASPTAAASPTTPAAATPEATAVTPEATVATPEATAVTPEASPTAATPEPDATPTTAPATPVDTPTAVPTAPVATPTPATAANVLTPGQTVQDSLVGSTAGAFATYEFACEAGAGSQTITMEAFGSDPSIADALNFGVYGPAGLVGQGLTTGTPGERELTFTCDPAGTYIVQVYNYVDGFTLLYTLMRSTGS